MSHLIVPAAGLSTRYGLSRPKFLLQHPEGRTMLSAGLAGLRNQPFDTATVVSLAAYFEDLDATSIEREASAALGCDVSLLLLETPTSSMVETVAQALYRMADDGPIVLKDTDNYISPGDQRSLGDGDFIAVADVASFPTTRVDNKSFVEVDANGNVTNIVEKRVISSEMNTGLVGFRSAAEFLETYGSLSSSNAVYVSDIVRAQLEEGHAFEAVPVSAYDDWGTLQDWRAYCATFSTLFVDIDGVTAVNENPHGRAGGWARFRPITENLDFLVERFQAGRTTFVFTTSRGERHRGAVEDALRSAGITQFHLVMGLPHARRTLVNDYAPTNPYPSASAVNIPRDATTLRDFFNA